MEPLAISVIIAPDGTMEVQSWRDDDRKKANGHHVDLTGLDGRLLRLFERWLTVRDRQWTDEEIRVFGQLLHRRLFPNDVWAWISQRIANRGDEMVRLMLAFPSDAAASRLASMPWEFLCAPDRPGDDGRLLVLMPGLLLSRSVPAGTALRGRIDPDQVRILPVVGEATSRYLGPVDYQPVLDAIVAAGSRPDFVTLDALVDATKDALTAAVLASRPHVVHFMGHGRFRDGRGAVALRGPDGGTQWLDEDRLATALCSADWAPTIVILHACEGGRNDYEYRFAGLAPGLVRHGVQCVVAMQYPVTNAVAVEFSTALYQALVTGQALDEAVQTARERVWTSSGDSRLLGVPMIYQQTAELLLGVREAKAGGS